MRFLLLFCSLVIFSCNSLDSTNSIALDNIYDEWVQSFEEESGSVKIFRPGNYLEFPVARFRQKYIFMANYLCKYYVLDAYDAHHYKNGIWSFNAGENLLTIYDLDQQIIIKYHAMKLSNDILELIAR